MLKIFHNEEEVKSWQKERDDKWKWGTYVPYSRIIAFDFPCVVDIEHSNIEINSNGRDTEYFPAISISDLVECEEFKEIFASILAKTKS